MIQECQLCRSGILFRVCLNDVTSNTLQVTHNASKHLPAECSWLIDYCVMNGDRMWFDAVQQLLSCYVWLIQSCTIWRRRCKLEFLYIAVISGEYCTNGEQVIGKSPTLSVWLYSTSTFAYISWQTRRKDRNAHQTVTPAQKFAQAPCHYCRWFL